jgi:hypothetical protein
MGSVRFRTLRCYPLSEGIESSAATGDIIAELLVTMTSERMVGRLAPMKR